VFTRDPLNRESVTVIEAICAAGYVIDPFIIMPGKIFQEKLWNNNLPPDSKIGLGEKGYTDDELVLKWLWHFHY